jgi:hypothetical protein
MKPEVHGEKGMLNHSMGDENCGSSRGIFFIKF